MPVQSLIQLVCNLMQSTIYVTIVAGFRTKDPGPLNNKAVYIVSINAKFSSAMYVERVELYRTWLYMTEAQ